MQESNRAKCQGLMTVTNKHLVYASLQDSAFAPNKRWRLNTINKIVSDKNSLCFETEDENISFEMEKPNKVCKLVRKQKKKIQEKEKKRATVIQKEFQRRASLEHILGTVITQGNTPNKIVRRNTSVERVEKHSFETIKSAPCRRTMALPLEPTENPYCNLPVRNAERVNTHLEPVREMPRNSFKRHQSLPPTKNNNNNKSRYESTENLTNEDNCVYSSGMSSSEDDFTDLRLMEGFINERKCKLEKSRPYRTQSVSEALDGDYVTLARESSQHASIYDNLPNRGLYANGSCPFERVPSLGEMDCHYAALQITTSDTNVIHQNEETSDYTKIDFLATQALELTRNNWNSA